jgi:hypothetical protein
MEAIQFIVFGRLATIKDLARFDSRSGVFPASSISFHETTADCSEIPRIGGVRGGPESKKFGRWLGDNRLASLACFSESYGALRHTPGENVDFVTKFEKELRKRYQHLKTEMAKIEHLIDAFEKGAKRGAKPAGRGGISAAGRKRISLAQKARWAKRKKG